MEPPVFLVPKVNRVFRVCRGCRVTKVIKEKWGQTDTRAIWVNAAHPVQGVNQGRWDLRVNQDLLEYQATLALQDRQESVECQVQWVQVEPKERLAKPVLSGHQDRQAHLDLQAWWDLKGHVDSVVYPGRVAHPDREDLLEVLDFLGILDHRAMSVTKVKWVDPDRWETVVRWDRRAIKAIEDNVAQSG